jgi:hypothetical protein
MWDRMRWVLIALGVLFIAGIMAVNVFNLFGVRGSDDAAARELVYVVPEGTSAKLNAGQVVAVLPNQVELVIGAQDTLVIRNADSAPIEVGGVKIQPGQQYKQQFTRPGTFDLVCSVHDSDRIRVVVLPPR